MNNEGWGLPEMLVLCSVLIIALIIASFYIKTLGNRIKDNVNTRPSVDTSTSNTDNTNKVENNITKPTEEDNNAKYTKLENKIELLSQKYIYKIYNNEIGDSAIIVDMDHLLEEDASGDLIDDLAEYSCKGYAKVYKNDTVIEYNPYIKCTNYTTIGFEDFYIN